MTTLPRALATMAAGAALLAAAAAAEPESSSSFNVAHPNSKDDDFRKCFCWDSDKMQFCGGPYSGKHSFWNSDACQRWSATASWSMAPLILLGIFFILYPMVFAVSRLVFNCCGGRKPSFDCCFSSKDARDRFPGYTRGTVWFTRIVFTLCFAAILSLSVNSYVASHKFKNSAFAMMDVVDDGAKRMDNQFLSATYAAHALRNKGAAPSFLTEAEAAAVDEVSKQFDNVKDNIDDAVNDMKLAGHHDHKDKKDGHKDRRSPFEGVTNAAVSIPLILVAVAFVMMLFKVTGLPVTIVACLFSLGAAILTFTFMVVLALSISTTTVCRNYDATAVPAAVGGLTLAGVCGDKTAVQVAAVNGMTAVAKHVQDPASDVCKAYNAAGVAGRSTCGGNAHFAPVEALQIFVTDMAKGKGSPKEVVEFADKFASPALDLGSIAAQVAKCDKAVGLLDGSVADALCSDKTGVADTLSVVAIQLGALLGTCALTLFILIRGIKRFGNMKGSKKYAVAEGDLVENGEYVSQEQAGQYAPVASSGYGTVEAVPAYPTKPQQAAVEAVPAVEQPAIAVVTGDEGNLQQPLCHVDDNKV